MRRYLLFLAMLSAVAVIGGLDLLTGPEVGMSLFYLAPIAVTAWYVGSLYGIALSVIAAAAWYGADLSAHGTATLAVSTWNGFTRLAIYVAASALLSLLRADRRRLHDLLVLSEQNARTDVITAAIERVAGTYPDTGLGASIGLTELDPAADIETTVRAADAAMYAEKSVRKGVSVSRR